jgi:hypothetical protein
MVSTIRKRDGKLVPYDNYKIANAIYKAAEAVGGHDFGLALDLAREVEQTMAGKFHPNSIPAVEEIQDLVEKVLIERGHARVAKAFILYREQRRRARGTQDLLLDIKNTMDGYLSQEDWRVHENANVNYSLGGLILHNSGAITANYWLESIYSHEIAEAYRNGETPPPPVDPCSADGQFPGRAAERVGRRAGVLIIRHVPGAVRAGGQALLRGGEAGRADVCVRREHALAVGLAGTVHEYHA